VRIGVVSLERVGIRGRTVKHDQLDHGASASFASGNPTSRSPGQSQPRRDGRRKRARPTPDSRYQAEAEVAAL
jgi:hypothetical protein